MDKPILFSGPMVRAIIEGRKTQTRRIITKQAARDAIAVFGPQFLLLPGNLDLARYAVGNHLWVREAWRCNGWATDVATIFYRASEGNGYTAMCEQFPVSGKARQKITGAWRPSIHMPRWASRLTLTVTDVRVQRLQDVSEEDAQAEGTRQDRVGAGTFIGREGPSNLVTPWPTAREAFADLWDSINAKRGFGWDVNPWVVAVSFDVRRSNIDALASKDAAE